MQIIYKTGDLLEFGERFIAHSCNIAGGFGSGVAGAIAKKYPSVRTEYLDLYNHGSMNLGDIQICQPYNTNLRIINMFCQPNYGYDGKRYVSYDAVDLALAQLDECSEGLEVLQGSRINIAFPLFGTHLGGGRWPILAALLEMHSNNFQPIVYTLDGKIPE